MTATTRRPGAWQRRRKYVMQHKLAATEMSTCEAAVRGTCLVAAGVVWVALVLTAEAAGLLWLGGAAAMALLARIALGRWQA